MQHARQDLQSHSMTNREPDQPVRWRIDSRHLLKAVPGHERSPGPSGCMDESSYTSPWLDASDPVAVSSDLSRVCAERRRGTKPSPQPPMSSISSPLFRQILPVRASSKMPNLASVRCMAYVCRQAAACWEDSSCCKLMHILLCCSGIP